MPILLLTRHATNDFVKTGRLPGQSPNIHLNDEGRAQASRLAEALAGQTVAAIYTSQLERAIETAWMVAIKHNQSIIIRPHLADTDAGDLTGFVVNDISKDDRYKDAWKVIVEKPSEGRLPGGEGLADMQNRVVACLAAIVRSHPDAKPEPKPAQADQTNKVAEATPKESSPVAHEPPPMTVIVVVMHNDPIKAALANYLGMPFDNFQRLGCAPASVSAVMVDNDNQAKMVSYINKVAY